MKRGVDDMKNKIIDLNNHLFAQIERLGDEDLKSERLEFEVGRTKAIRDCAVVIIDNARLALKAHTLINEGLINTAPEMLGMEPLKKE